MRILAYRPELFSASGSNRKMPAMVSGRAQRRLADINFLLSFSNYRYRELRFSIRWR